MGGDKFGFNYTWITIFSQSDTINCDEHACYNLTRMNSNYYFVKLAISRVIKAFGECIYSCICRVWLSLKQDK